MSALVKMLVLGVVALLILALYSYSDLKIEGAGSELRKADFANLYHVDESLLPDNTFSDKKLLEAPGLAEDTGEIIMEPDTAKNILLFGDSMIEGLCRRFIDYADQNRHELHSVIWYSSTSELWAETDTLQYFINKYSPDYAVICLCSNELFIKEPEKRKENIKKIITKLGDIPYVWISPPNWKDDTGINDVILSVVGERRYFDSRNLELERGKDHAHPTFPAAAIWMDTIARWIQSPACRNPIMMEFPEKEVASRNVTVLQPVR